MLAGQMPAFLRSRMLFDHCVFNFDYILPISMRNRDMISEEGMGRQRFG